MLGDAVALHGVAKYPARVKCALLGWTALSEALLPSGTLGRVRHGSLPEKENA